MADTSRICLLCVNSMSADAPDGSEVLVCFDCPGHRNQERIVDEEDCCENFKGQ